MQQITEAITAIGGIFKEGLPAAQVAPELTPLIFDMVSLVARTLKGGRSLEDSIEQAKNAVMQRIQQAAQNPPPDPVQQEMEMKREEHQMDMQGKQLDAEVHQMKASADMQKIVLQTQAAQQKAMMPEPERVQ